MLWYTGCNKGSHRRTNQGVNYRASAPTEEITMSDDTRDIATTDTHKPARPMK